MRLINKQKIFQNYQSYILTFLIISGPIKPLFNRFVLNIDITLIAFFIAGCDLLYQMVNKFKFSKSTFSYLLALVLIFVLMCFSLFYTSSDKYSLNKSLSFVLVIFCFLYAIHVKKFNPNVFLKSIYFVVIPLSLWFIYYRQFFWSIANSKTRTYEDGFHAALGSYLGLGYILSLGVFVLLAKRKGYMLVFVLFLILALGARGPLMFCLITMFFLNFKIILSNIVSYKIKVNKLIIFISIMMSSLVIFIYKFEFIKDRIYKYGFDRFVSLFSSGREDLSANVRLEVVSFAMNSIFTNPITFFFWEWSW